MIIITLEKSLPPFGLMLSIQQVNKEFCNFNIKHATWFMNRNIITILILSHDCCSPAVKIPRPGLLVYIVYFTSWVDDDGLLHFAKDIYGHDKVIASHLFKE